MADDSGSTVGETAPELIRITFTSVPTGMLLTAGLGGMLGQAGNTWTFTGTEAQSNAIGILTGPGASAGIYQVNLSAVTLDGSDTLATAVTDTFQLTVSAPTNAGQTLTGTGIGNTLTGGAGNDVISGLGGNDTLSGGNGSDLIAGGLGADTMTGGGGRDRFVYATGDHVGSLDTITDFALGSGGDQIDLSALLSGFNPQSSTLSQFVRASANTIQVDVDGAAGGAAFVNVATLTGAGALDIDAMRANGNLIV
jgi:Ca2+-binding RTX toxin-like protein